MEAPQSLHKRHGCSWAMPMESGTQSRQAAGLFDAVMRGSTAPKQRFLFDPTAHRCMCGGITWVCCFARALGARTGERGAGKR